MRSGRVLLVVDLEGVAGVDTVEALLAGTAAYERARALLTAEVNRAVEGLLQAGYAQVRVSDSHQSGSGEANVLREALHPAAELCFEEDWYSPRVFEDVRAVACLGMHAPAGTTGFAAHTVELLGAWACAGRVLSEAELVLGLAAEAGVPGVFVSGDDVLEAHLGGRVAYVRTKQALSSTRALSREPEEVHEALARAAALPGRKVEPLPGAPLVLTFKSARQAALAEEAGARRLGRHRVEVEGGSFRERYQRAFRVAAATSRVLEEGLRGEPGSAEFVEDLQALFQVPWPPARPPAMRQEDTSRALRAFLSLTAGEGEGTRALRALTLHMLEAHAPAVFSRHALGPTLEQAVAALASVPVDFPPGLSPEVAMARVDAWYLQRERGLAPPAPDAGAFHRYLLHLDEEGYGLYAWLLGALARACGMEVRLSFAERALRKERLLDLYWLTHLYLLDTRYLRAPLKDPRAAAWTEELLVAVPWVLSRGHMDLAAELAFCLQCAGEVEGGAHAALLEELARRLQPDGRMLDGTMEGTAEEAADHATAGALLALAGAEERLAPPR